MRLKQIHGKKHVRFIICAWVSDRISQKVRQSIVLNAARGFTLKAADNVGVAVPFVDVACAMPFNSSFDTDAFGAGHLKR